MSVDGHGELVVGGRIYCIHYHINLIDMALIELGDLLRLLHVPVRKHRLVTLQYLLRVNLRLRRKHRSHSMPHLSIVDAALEFLRQVGVLV